jgi:hypothetical protein
MTCRSMIGSGAALQACRRSGKARIIEAAIPVCGPEVLLHVITETACHAGHLDAARELIDGRQWIVLT